MAVVETLDFKADISDLRSQLSSASKLTDKEITKMLKSLESQYKRTQNAIKKSQKKTKSSFEEMSDGAQKAGGAFGAFGSALSPISPALGGVVGGMGAMTSAAGLLLNPVGLAVAGILALGAATVGTVAGMTIMTVKAGEYLETMKGFQDIPGVPGVSDEQIASVKAANDALGALSAVFKQVVIVLGAEFAPYVEQGARYLLAFGLRALDVVSNLTKAQGIIKNTAVLFVKAFADTITNSLRVTAMAVASFAEYVKPGNELSAGINHQIALYDEWSMQLAQSVVDFSVSKIGDAVAYLGTNLDITNPRIDAFIAASSKMGEEAKVSEKNIINLSDRILKLNAIAAENSDSGYEFIQFDSANIIAEMDRVALEAEAKAEEIRERWFQTISSTLNSVGSLASTTGDVIGRVADNAAERADKLDARAKKAAENGNMRRAAELKEEAKAERKREKRMRKSALKAFRIWQAAGIANATISTYKGAAGAFADTTGGIVLRTVAGSAAIAAGLANVAQISATPPPQAHMGGFQIGRSGPSQPDEMLNNGLRTTRQEAVLDSGSATKIINELVRKNQTVQREVVVTLPTKHFDERMESLLKSNSRTARAIRPTGKLVGERR